VQNDLNVVLASEPSYRKLFSSHLLPRPRAAHESLLQIYRLAHQSLLENYQPFLKLFHRNDPPTQHSPHSAKNHTSSESLTEEGDCDISSEEDIKLGSRSTLQDV
jgi:hypothetical protein